MPDRMIGIAWKEIDLRADCFVLTDFNTFFPFYPEGVCGKVKDMSNKKIIDSISVYKPSVIQ